MEIRRKKKRKLAEHNLRGSGSVYGDSTKMNSARAERGVHRTNDLMYNHKMGTTMFTIPTPTIKLVMDMKEDTTVQEAFLYAMGPETYLSGDLNKIANVLTEGKLQRA